MKKTKMPADLNQRAKKLVDLATGTVDVPASDKNPAAVELGRLGGRKGGVHRALSLSPKQRSDIARKAARARWSRRDMDERVSLYPLDPETALAALLNVRRDNDHEAPTS